MKAAVFGVREYIGIAISRENCAQIIVGVLALYNDKYFLVPYYLEGVGLKKRRLVTVNNYEEFNIIDDTEFVHCNWDIYFA